MPTEHLPIPVSELMSEGTNHLAEGTGNLAHQGIVYFRQGAEAVAGFYSAHPVVWLAGLGLLIGGWLTPQKVAGIDMGAVKSGAALVGAGTIATGLGAEAATHVLPAS